MKPESFLALFSLPGGTEWIVILLLALLLFGRRLPDVARSFGKSIVEFKKGIRDVKDDLENDDHSKAPSLPRGEQKSIAPTSSSAPANKSNDADRASSNTD